MLSIKKAEKYLKTDLKYLIKGGFWLTLTKVIVLATSFATSIAFANLLSQNDYGVYQYVLSVFILLVIPSLSGVDTALTRTIAKGGDGAFLTALKAKLKWGVLGSIVSVALSGYYYITGDTVLSIAFLLASVFVPIFEPANLYVAYLTGKKEFKIQTYYQLVVRSVATIVVIGCLFLTKNIILILTAYFISYTALRLFFLFTTLKKIPKEAGGGDETISYGIHLTILTIPTLVSKTLDSLIVFNLLGPVALAGYVLARTPIKQGMNFMNSINMLALPQLSKRSESEIRNTLLKKISFSYIVIIPICVAYWYLAPPFFHTFYPKYTDFIFISQIFSLQLLTLPLSLLDTALTALSEKKKMYTYTLITASLRIILLIILIPLFGIMGAAVSFIATSLIGSVLLMFLFTRLKSEKSTV